MRRRQVDLWYQSSFGRSRSVETSRNSSLSSQHSWLAVELGAQHGPSSLRYLTVSAYIPDGFGFICTSPFTNVWTQKQMSLVLHNDRVQMFWLNGAGAVLERRPHPFACFLPVSTNQILSSATAGVTPINNPAGFDLGLFQICQVIITNMYMVFMVCSEGF